MTRPVPIGSPVSAITIGISRVACFAATAVVVNHAANISLSQLGDDPAHARVAVDGRFEAGDEIKFRTQVGRLTKAVVVFNSEGGNLQADIDGIATGCLWRTARTLPCSHSADCPKF